MKKESEKRKNSPKNPIKSLLLEDGLLIQSLDEADQLLLKGYGKKVKEGVKLNFYEGLYLLSRGTIEVWDEINGEKITFEELLEKSRKYDEDSWVKYLIYRDLRSRGYVVREGFGLGIDFRVYERGKYGKEAADHLIYGIKEGRPILIRDLSKALNYVQNLKKKLILAVLNRRGEVVYYSLSKLVFKREEKGILKNNSK